MVLFNDSGCKCHISSDCFCISQILLLVVFSPDALRKGFIPDSDLHQGRLAAAAAGSTF